MNKQVGPLGSAMFMLVCLGVFVALLMVGGILFILLMMASN